MNDPNHNPAGSFYRYVMRRHDDEGAPPPSLRLRLALEVFGRDINEWPIEVTEIEHRDGVINYCDFHGYVLNDHCEKCEELSWSPEVAS